MAQLADLTETGMANLALSMARQEGIESLDDSPEHPARVCRKWFAVTRDALIRKGQWNFAKWYVSLPALAAPVPAFKWTTYFAKPVDALKILAIEGCSEDDWEVVGPYIATDAAAPINVTYSRRVTEVPQWDALFRVLFASALANAIAPELAQDERIFELIEAATQRALDDATPSDSAEGTPETPSDLDYETVRVRF